jgi:hypothetical protein
MTITGIIIRIIYNNKNIIIIIIFLVILLIITQYNQMYNYKFLNPSIYFYSY